MEPLDRDELSNEELDRVLRAWTAPPAPAQLKGAIFGSAGRPWWWKLWSASVRIPAPALLILAALLGIAFWRRNITGGADHQLQPVAELRPKIIRSANAQN